MKKQICKTELAPFEWSIDGKFLFWGVYYVVGERRRIKIKTFKTEKGAYRFYNSLPLDY